MDQDSVFPGDSEQQKIGRAGEATAAAFFAKPELGLAWRWGGASTDWGVDGELEFVGSTATGLLIKAQIKGSKDTARLRRTGSQSVSVKPQTWNYWAAIHLPVVVVLVDIRTDDIYWTVPERAFSSGKTSVRFVSDREARSDPKRFAAALRRAARSPASAEILDQISHHVNTFRRLRQNHAWLNMWGTVAELDVGQIAVTYDHVLRLRTLMGLEAQPVPYAMWLARSQAICDRYGWDDHTGLVEAVGRELLEYVQPFFVEALVHAGEVAHIGNVARAHPRLAELAESGVLTEANLEVLFDPDSLDPPVEHGVRYFRDFGALADPSVQLRLDARLADLGVGLVSLFDQPQ